MCTPLHASGDLLWDWGDQGISQLVHHSSWPMQGHLWDREAGDTLTSPAPYASRAPTSLRVDLNYHEFQTRNQAWVQRGYCSVQGWAGQQRDSWKEGQAFLTQALPMVWIMVWDLSCLSWAR